MIKYIRIGVSACKHLHPGKENIYFWEENHYEDHKNRYSFCCRTDTGFRHCYLLSAATFDMNTPAITGEGIVLENPGDSITTEGTGEYLVFDSDFTMRWEYKFGEYAEDVYSDIYDGDSWSGVTEFFIDDNGIYRISEWGDNDYFYPDEGCIYVVTYEPAASGDDSTSSGSD